MVRSLLFLLLTVFISKSLTAQQSSAVNNSNSEKPPAAISPSSAGFKKQSSSPSPRQKKKTTGDRTKVSDKQTMPTGNSENASTAASIVATDYARMPADVQLKINNNKTQGKNQLDGIVKGFTVQIKACATSADCEKVLSFLKTNKGFISSEFVSTGLVKIFVDPTFDSVDLKDLMNAEGIGFNFLNRFYLLKK